MNFVDKVTVDTDSMDLLSGVSFRGDAGSNGTPSISFVGDTDSGFYSSATNEVGLSLGGALTYDFGVNGDFDINGDSSPIVNIVGTSATVQIGVISNAARIGTTTNDELDFMSNNAIQMSLRGDAALDMEENGYLIRQHTDVTATGSDQGGAAALDHFSNNVTGADNTVGVILPTAEDGMEIVVYNNAAANTLELYPATSDAINGGSANVAVTVPADEVARCIARDATNWYCTSDALL